jgi:hypothetical protein
VVGKVSFVFEADRSGAFGEVALTDWVSHAARRLKATDHSIHKAVGRIRQAETQLISAAMIERLDRKQVLGGSGGASVPRSAPAMPEEDRQHEEVPV